MIDTTAEDVYEETLATLIDWYPTIPINEKFVQVYKFIHWFNIWYLTKGLIFT